MAGNSAEVWENYIFFKKQDWTKNKSKLYDATPAKDEMSITQAYKENALKLRRNFPDILPDNFGSDIVKVLESYDKDLEEKNGLEEDFFQKIEKFMVELNSQKVELTNTNGKTVNLGLSQININNRSFKRLKQAMLTQESFNNLMDTYEKILGQISEFDNAFTSISGESANESGGVPVFMTIDGLKATKTAYDRMKNFINNSRLKNASGFDTQEQIEAFYKEAAVSSANLTSNIRGGLTEYLTYIQFKGLQGLDKLVREHVDELSKEGASRQNWNGIKVTNAELSGAGSTEIKDESLSEFLGQSTFQNKSDVIVDLEVLTNDGLSITINTGVSVKGYGIDSHKTGKLADSVKWQAVFASGDILDSQVEYNLANMLIHKQTRGIISNMTRKYIAAKASAFLISGVAGGNQPQAMFFRYADKMIFIPDALETGHFNLSLTMKGGSGDLTQKWETGKGTNKQNAYERTKNTISKLRQQVKFMASTS